VIEAAQVTPVIEAAQVTPVIEAAQVTPVIVKCHPRQWLPSADGAPYRLHCTAISHCTAQTVLPLVRFFPSQPRGVASGGMEGGPPGGGGGWRS
jgi:hypothetical protein